MEVGFTINLSMRYHVFNDMIKRPTPKWDCISQKDYFDRRWAPNEGCLLDARKKQLLIGLVCTCTVQALIVITYKVDVYMWLLSILFPKACTFKPLKAIKPTTSIVLSSIIKLIFEPFIDDAWDLYILKHWLIEVRKEAHTLVVLLVGSATSVAPMVVSCYSWPCMKQP